MLAELEVMKAAFADLSAGEAVREADIICAATSAKAPVFADADLRPGVHINGVGWTGLGSCHGP